MSITSTRKVSGSPSPARHPERRYLLGIQGNSFVENIDTTNNVSINDDSANKHNDSGQSFSEKDKEKEKKNISSSSAYVASAIEALAASGVYESMTSTLSSHSALHKVGVYDNNQSIFKNEHEERNGHPYLKHFYEKNEVVEEVDEFV